ncbi:solute carrier family 22 member 2-like [Bolinopsis microptera]|uniref:solute carrier family 22 member 2-like n=1 Tax=Bolinopsis microptera TaxID=2820187 RepID=UPI003078FA33
MKERFQPLSEKEEAAEPEENDNQLHDRLSMEELVDKAVGTSKGRYVGFVSLFMLSNLTASLMCYLPVLTGYIPYTEWQCVSERCYALLENHAGENHTFYTRDAMCSNDLEADIDFIWTPKRSSFAVDFGIYCGTESQKSNIDSFYFIGAFVGLLGSSSLFDMFGRKKVTLGGGLFAVAATIGMAFATNLQTMLGLRVMQGLGVLVAMTGRYVWCMEFTPLRLRNVANTLIQITWPLGTGVLILVCYMVTNWRFSVGIVSFISFLFYLQLLVCPESPRFFAFRNKEEEAMEILNKLARFYNNPALPENCLEREVDQVGKSDGFLKQMKAFILYPVMLRRTVFLMICWFTVSLFYYGLSFGWHKMGSNIFASQGFGSLSEVVACTLSFTLVGTAGRKKTQMVAFLGIGICFGIAMIDVPLSSTWQLQQVACLFAIVFIATEFVTVYLYTAELSPTSHRGMIMSLCSGTARIGSFMGPYLSLLYDVLDRRIVLGMFGGMGLLAAVGTFFLLEDSTGMAVAETPAGLQGAKRLEEEESVQDDSP